MFKYNFKYELKSLFRNRWIQLLSGLLVVLFLFAAYNGKQKVDKRLADIAEVQAEVDEGDAKALLLLDSLEAGHKVDVPTWQLPNMPQVLGNYYPRAAAMPPAEMALVATGQSDIYTHYVKPSLRGEDFTLNFTELSSPVQLLFGSFDLSFVIIYLLPLIVIAFTYDLLSSEREQGSLRLLASQPLTLFNWLFQKVGLRFLLLTVIITVSSVVALAANGVSIAEHGAGFGQMRLLTLGYMLFWFILAFLVNLLGKSSANNAVSLLALWVAFVLLIPSVVSQLANSLYPVPSRAQTINDMRVVKKEVEAKQDEILDGYLRDHPELAAVKSESANSFWTRYFASQDIVEQEMQPVLDRYESQLKRQQNWVNQWRFASPAILVQDGFNELSQTATRHYQDYREQVIAFAAEWREFFIPMIFKDEKVTKATFEELPAFEYETSGLPSYFSANVLGLLVYSVLLLGISIAAFRQRGKERIMAGA